MPDPSGLSDIRIGRGARWGFILTASALSSLYVFNHVIRPYPDIRMELIADILAGNAEPPYLFRVLKHWLVAAITPLLSVLLDDPRTVHKLGYGILLFGVLISFNALVHSELRARFGDVWSLVGVAWMQLLIPLSTTGAMMEGDFVTLLAYALALRCMRLGYDWSIPLIVVVAAFNREQAIFIAAIHGLHFVAQRRLASWRTAAILATEVVAWGVVFVGLRWWHGFPESRFTVASHIAYNTDPSVLALDILPLWAAVVIPILVFAWRARRQANAFERLLFPALVPYTILFFLLGKMDELAKYLPAMLLMLPIALLGLGARPRDDPV